LFDVLNVNCEEGQRAVMKRLAKKVCRQERKQVEKEKKAQARAKQKQKTHLTKSHRHQDCSSTHFIQALTVQSMLLSSSPMCSLLNICVDATSQCFHLHPTVFLLTVCVDATDPLVFP
jgi:hypothetical protein